MPTNFDQLINDEKPANYRRRALMMTAIAMVVVYVLWNIPLLRLVLYPLNLFTTYVHEAGHAVATIITGGHVLGFLVSLDTSGLTARNGGADWLVAPAGYLGAALFGSLLFYFINRFPRIINAIATVSGIAVVIFTLRFARPDETGVPVALFFGVVSGMVLMGIGLRANALITLLVLNILAVSTALQAFLDLRYIIFVVDASRGDVANDAVKFSQLVTPWIPPIVIAITWAAIAVIMFATALYYGAWKPLHREINESYERIVNR